MGVIVAINILCNEQNTKSGKFETVDGKLLLITKRVLDLSLCRTEE